MPLVALKTPADLRVDLGGDRYITLKGFGLLTQVSDSDWADAKKNPCVVDMLDNGFIVEDANAENSHADLMSDLSNKQEASMGKDIEPDKKAKGKK